MFLRYEANTQTRIKESELKPKGKPTTVSFIKPARKTNK